VVGEEITTMNIYINPELTTTIAAERRQAALDLASYGRIRRAERRAAKALRRG
jgi:hypothetical protein